MANKKSAKDIAFDKERAKFRHEINELKRDVRILSKTVEKLGVDINSLEEENERLTNENNALKTASEVSPEELKVLVAEAKHNAELREKMSNLFSLGKTIGFVGKNTSVFGDELHLCIDEDRPFSTRHREEL